MTIETKWNVGDPAWRMKDNKVLEDRIEEIVIRVSHPKNQSLNIEESYILYFGGGGYDKSRIFPTKEALINSL